MPQSTNFREPWQIGPIKVWPCYSRPDFQWFIAYEGLPYFFRSKGEAQSFAKDKLSGERDVTPELKNYKEH